VSVAAHAGARRPATLASLGALYGVVLRSQATLPRILGVGALGALAVLLGVLARIDDDRLGAAADAAAAYGLGVLVPLATLWLGTAALGDLVEDRLLVYLWLKPVPRWQLPAAAIIATFSIVAPLTVVPQVAGALVAGANGLALASALSLGLAALAYSSLFVAVGLWFRRAVWIGIAFILLWENVVAQISDGTARLTITGWARAILAEADTGGADITLGDLSARLALVVLPALAAAGWVAATYRYRRADVD
jgi:ABC-2 type transport system permease protein